MTHGNKTGACFLCMRPHGSWSFVGETASPPWDADKPIAFAGHLLTAECSADDRGLDAAWLDHTLALLGAQEPEGGAGAYPQTWREARLEADRAACQQEAWWHELAQLLARPGVSSVVPSGTCVTAWLLSDP